MNKFLEGALEFSLNKEEAEKMLVEIYWGGENSLETMANYMAESSLY